MKYRSRLAPSFRTATCRWGLGFERLGYVTNQKNGISALGLQRALGLGSYKTA